MNRLIFLRILFLFVIVGCSNDDDISSGPDVLTELNGTWNMTNVTGGFVGINHDFNAGTIVWVFNETDKTVVITNNNTDDSIEDMLPTGTYDYSTVDTQGNQELIVDGVNRGSFEITANQLNVNQLFRDGFRFTFNR